MDGWVDEDDGVKMGMFHGWANSISPFPFFSFPSAVNEFIGEDIQSFQTECQMDNQPN